MALRKTGEINYRDEAGALWHAESFENEETGKVTTEKTLIEAAPQAQG